MKNFDSLRNIFGGGIRKHVLLRLFCLGGRHDKHHQKTREYSGNVHTRNWNRLLCHKKHFRDHFVQSDYWSIGNKKRWWATVYTKYMESIGVLVFTITECISRNGCQWSKWRVCGHDRDKCRRKSSGLHESIIFFNEFQYRNERNGTSKDLIAKEVA